MSKNEEKKLAKELVQLMNKVNKDKNNNKRKLDKEEPFFSSEAVSLFTKPSERPPNLRKGGRKKKTMKKKTMKKKTMKKKTMKRKTMKKKT